jgi:hypothetical protein
MRWLLAKKEAAPMAAELVLEGALAPERRGRVLQVVGQAGGGSVSWSGARIELEPGSTLRLDPLAGREFPENKAKPK